MRIINDDRFAPGHVTDIPTKNQLGVQAIADKKARFGPIVSGQHQQ
jgi:hypothetical protein